MHIRIIKDRNTRFKLIFLGAVIFVSLFFSNQNLTYSYYMNTSKIIIYIPFFLFSLIVLAVNRKSYLDIISFLLDIRLVLYLIPLLYIDKFEGYWGNYFAVIASFLAYLISSQHHYIDISKIINKMIAIFLSILSFQVICLFFLLRAQYGILNTGLSKLYMVIPIGSSNYIAGVILPLLIFTFYAEIGRNCKFIAVFLSLIALLIIKSKNAVLVLVIFISIKLIKAYLRSLRKIKDRSSIERLIPVVTVILIMTIVLTIFFSLKYFLVKWNMGMYFNNSSLYETINGLTSNRLNIYLMEIKRWTKHIFFGNGLSYDIGYPRSHNWIIELLVQSGVVGFIIFIIAIIKWYKKVKRHLKENCLVKSTFYSCLVVLFQGLAEVTMFTISIDILFWFLLGLSISEVNYLKAKNKSA